MTMMRAAFIEGTGPAEAIQVGELPVPEPGPTDVLVRVDAASVNPVDAYIRAGLYRTLMPLPFVVGRDLTGTVAAAGPGTAFRAGEPVWCNSLGYDGRQGCCAEFAVVPAERLYRLPGGADPVNTVADFHPAATAFIALHRRARVRAHDTVLIGGAAGSVGASGVVFAAEAGARVIGTARPRDHERCRELGADEVFDFDDPDLPAKVAEAAPDGVDICWDTSGRADLNLLAPTIGVRGQVLLTAGRQGGAPVSIWPFYTRDISLIGFVISRAPVGDLADAAAAINRRLSNGGLPPRVAEVVDFEHTAAAHTRVEARTPGRTVIRVRRAG
jgi:NADPH:quinone reductase-like Zn-dependent oxidoreductase